MRLYEAAFLLLCAATTLATGSLEALVGGVLFSGSTRIAYVPLRLLVQYGFMLWFYLAIERFQPLTGIGLQDAWLQSLDQRFFGGTPAPALPHDLMSVAYFAYLPYLHGIALFELFTDRAEHLAKRLYLAFTLGYVGYLLVPAEGPRYALSIPVEGGWLTQANASFMEAGSPGTDVFPSLHVLITLIVWTHDWRWSRRRAALCTPLVIALCLSTLSLRYHYAIDLVAAVAIYGVVQLTTWRRRPPDTSRSASPTLP